MCCIVFLKDIQKYQKNILINNLENFIPVENNFIFRTGTKEWKDLL